ncbi:hypothetical protein TNCV_5091621 [Trichonephila clavipes]|nr:hypothetical protein TNCV_5091621 [Trichonephila clavipes]
MGKCFQQRCNWDFLLRVVVTSKQYVPTLHDFVESDNAVVGSSATSWFMTWDFVTHTIVRVGRYLSHCSCKGV